MGKKTKAQHTGKKAWEEARKNQVPPLTKEQLKRPVEVHPLSNDLPVTSPLHCDFHKERPMLPERSDWTPDYMVELANYEPPHFGLPRVLEWQPDRIRTPYMADKEMMWLVSSNMAALHTMRVYKALEAARAPYSVIEHYALAIEGLLGLIDKPTEKLNAPRLPAPKPAAPPEAVQALQSNSLVAELAAIPVTKTSEAVAEDRAIAKAPVPAQTIDEMVEAVVYAAEHWHTDPESRRLFDGFYLRENGPWLNLKHGAVIGCVVVAMHDIKTKAWEVNSKTIRGEVRRYLIKVKDTIKLQPKAPALRSEGAPPFATMPAAHAARR
jgi:hypothetical protein